MGDVGLAIQRAEEKTDTMKARAGAIDELLASGALEDFSGPKDDIQAELDRMGSGPGVDLELEQLKAELGQGPAPKELNQGTPTAQPQQQQQDTPSRPRGRRTPGCPVIVRLMGEGQLDVAEDDLSALNILDGELESAIESGDETAFRAALHALLDNVRKVGGRSRRTAWSRPS